MKEAIVFVALAMLAFVVNVALSAAFPAYGRPATFVIVAMLLILLLLAWRR